MSCRRWVIAAALALIITSIGCADAASPPTLTISGSAVGTEANGLLIASPHVEDDADAASCARTLSGTEDDWERLLDALGATLADVRDASLDLRIRMLGGSAVGYARITRRWWTPPR